MKIETKDFYNNKPFKVLHFNKKRKKFFEDISIKGNVLDVGVGAGRTTLLIKRMFPFTNITVLDISKNTLDSLPFENKILGDVLNLPFKDKEFNFVVSIGVLHHTNNPRKGFRECCRVLKEEGGIVIAMVNKLNTFKLIYNIFKRFPNSIKAKITHSVLYDELCNPHTEFFSLKEIKRWFEEEGIKLIKYSSTGHYPPYFINKYKQLIYYYGIKSKN